MKINILYTQIMALALCCASLVGAEERLPSESTIRIMSFNIWRDGNGGKQPLSQTAKVIQMAKADVVGLQEAKPAKVKAIADMLGWHHNGTVISRFKIVENKGPGIKLRLNSGQEIVVFNNHFAHAPYQPYQLLSIPYGKGKFIKTEKEAIAEAGQARGHQVAALLKAIKALPEKELPVFILGDFNEPSHQDWTAKAATAGRHPIKVSYPTTHSLTKAGMVDAYRAVYPDEMKFPGYTWTPTTKMTDPKDHHDRIDFIFFRGKTVKVEGAQIVGESRKNADIVLSPYPSDHRAVVATFTVTHGS
ncbi:MAG: endonuclease/exonuclease/phosphatase family protein [Rubritalea sp.]|mgnify:CR=1 FL=1|tara:strand:- start:307 stop:1218 length:912 start_codon:yes stop_codon:yes gene_type:complete